MLGMYMSMADSPEEKSLFEQLYISNRNKMYSIAFSILKNSGDAEDAVHDAFMKVFSKADMLSGMSDEVRSCYLCSAARNIAISEYNKRKDNKTIKTSIDEMYDLAGDDNVEDDVLSSYGVERIKAALTRLSDKDYEIIFLTAYMDKTPADIAAFYNEPAGTVRQRLRRARQRLLKLLEEDESIEKEERSYV